jgi:hypothetical protein
MTFGRGVADPPRAGVRTENRSRCVTQQEERRANGRVPAGAALAWISPPTLGGGTPPCPKDEPMTVQIPVARHDDLAVTLSVLFEQRLARLADELEHADVTVYGVDCGLATRGAVIRMTLADLSAVLAEVALHALAGTQRGPA